MKKEVIRKGLVIGVICLFMMVYIPSIVGHYFKEYPKEDGPYKIFISGHIIGGSYKGHLPHIGPFWSLDTNQSIGYYFPRWLTIFKLNGLLQNVYFYREMHIEMNGFKGFAPVGWMEGMGFFFRSFVYGECESFWIVLF